MVSVKVLWISSQVEAHLQEHEDGLVSHADVAASASEVEKTLNLPANPHLILLG